MDDLSKFEADHWEAADNLRANSKLTSSDYFMPVLGILFLRHAATPEQGGAHLRLIHSPTRSQSRQESSTHF